MLEYMELEVYLHTLLTWTLDGGEQSASHSSCFMPREKAPIPH